MIVARPHDVSLRLREHMVARACLHITLLHVRQSMRRAIVGNMETATITEYRKVLPECINVRVEKGSPTFGVGRSEPTYGGGWSVSHGLVAVWTRSPDTSQPAAVLAAVKDKPYGRPERRAFLDCRSTRRRSDDVGRDGRMGSAGGTNKRMDLK